MDYRVKIAKIAKAHPGILKNAKISGNIYNWGPELEDKDMEFIYDLHHDQVIYKGTTKTFSIYKNKDIVLEKIYEFLVQECVEYAKAEAVSKLTREILDSQELEFIGVEIPPGLFTSPFRISADAARDLI